MACWMTQQLGVTKGLYGGMGAVVWRSDEGRYEVRRYFRTTEKVNFDRMRIQI